MWLVDVTGALRWGGGGVCVCVGVRARGVGGVGGGAQGWIAREQILGAEAESRVPEKFRNQDPAIANPPTMLLALAELLAQFEAAGSDGSARGRDFLEFAFGALQRYFGWLLRSQAGPVPYSFYWRGCTETHCFASGMDDYPRPTPPSRADQHVDLLSWVALVRALLLALAVVVVVVVVAVRWGFFCCYSCYCCGCCFCCLFPAGTVLLRLLLLLLLVLLLPLSLVLSLVRAYGSALRAYSCVCSCVRWYVYLSSRQCN